MDRLLELLLLSVLFHLGFSMKPGIPISSLEKTKSSIATSGKLLTAVGTSLFLPSSHYSANASEDWTKNIDITEVVFFRHAQSYNNVIYDHLYEKYGKDADINFLKKERKKLRKADCTLSKRGFQQASLLKSYSQNGGLKKSLGVDSLDDWTIFSSPMRRCLLTSQALSKGLHKPVYVHPTLYESGGCYDISPDGSIIGNAGSTSSEIEKEFSKYKCLPGMEHGWYYDKCQCNKPETMAEFRARAKSIVDWIWSVHNTPPQERHIDGKSFKNIMLVIHGNLLNAVISGLQGGSGLITHYNTGHSRLQLVTGRYGRQFAVVKYLNKIEHLDDVHHPELLTGNDTIRDQWIQEFQKDD